MKQPKIIEFGKCGDNVNYELAEDGVLTIYGKGNVYDYRGNLVSPFWGNSNIRYLVVSDGVTGIGAHAFKGCKSLSYVVVLSSTIEIGFAAFCECSRLTAINISKCIADIGYYAFYKCKSLSSVVLQDSIVDVGSFAFDGTPWLDSQPDGCVYINNCLYKYKGEMPYGTHINIKDGTTLICNNAFKECYNLCSIVIPKGVTYIGYRSFYHCSSLVYLSLPNTLEEIYIAAFEYCSSLKTITIPASVKIIWQEAFTNCLSLSSMVCLSPMPPFKNFLLGIKIQNLKVPKGTKQAYSRFVLFKNIEEIDVD